LIEFTSVLPLGNQTGITPTAAGITIYILAKRWIHIETDQELVYQLNGDTGQFSRITPILPGCPGIHGTMHLWGAIWSLVLINKSSLLAKVTVCTVE
jgi:hypothetical protein